MDPPPPPPPPTPKKRVTSVKFYNKSQKEINVAVGQQSHKPLTKQDERSGHWEQEACAASGM